MALELSQKFANRFEEIDRAYSSIKLVSNHSGQGYNSPGEWRQWATSAQHLILLVFGSDAIHVRNFQKQYDNCIGYQDELIQLLAVFRSAKEDYLAGLSKNFELEISGEVFGDFIALAKSALGEGYKDVAAVLASAALEDALKRFAVSNDIAVGDASMYEVINSLKSKGLIGGAQKSLIDSMPKIRNHSLHAEWDKITEIEVGSILGFVEQFLLTKFHSD